MITPTIEIKNPSKSFHGLYAVWSGGQMYDMCPMSGEKRCLPTLEKCADFVFSGLHYIHVISTVAPRRCFSPDPPCLQAHFHPAFSSLSFHVLRLFLYDREFSLPRKKRLNILIQCAP